MIRRSQLSSLRGQPRHACWEKSNLPWKAMLRPMVSLIAAQSQREPAPQAPAYMATDRCRHTQLIDLSPLCPRAKRTHHPPSLIDVVGFFDVVQILRTT